MARKKTRVKLDERTGAIIPSKSGGSKYSDQDIINVHALYDLYHSIPRVSEELHIPEGTVRQWILNPSEFVKARQAGMVDYDFRVKQTRDRMIRSTGYVLDRALQQVNDKISESSAAQAATIFGILYDKLEKMTSNGETAGSGLTVNLQMSDDDKLDLLQRVLDRQRRAEAEEAEYTVVEERK